MKWILIMLAFSGPTSSNKIKYGGSFMTELECKDAWEAQLDKSTWYGTRYDSYVCIPI